MFCRKLLVLPFRLRSLYSTLVTTDAHSQNLFSHFASTRFNISAAHITRIFKWVPQLQRLQTLDKVEQFVDLLNRHGCSEVQIAKIMMMQPFVILINAQRLLEPKIKLLEDFGFRGETIAKLLVRNPSILGVNLENELLPKMEFLKNLFQSQEVLFQSVHRAPLILTLSLEKTLKRSVVFWERWGFHGRELLQLIWIKPEILRCSSLMPAQADLIHEIGVNKESSSYKYIVSMVATSRIETLKAKIENLKLYGLSVEEVWQLCRARHRVLCYSKARVSETMNFFVEDMGFPPNDVVQHPYLFDKNLEKIIRPRFLVWLKIKSMNTRSLSVSVFSVLNMTEERFVRNIIRGHPEATTLQLIYENAISNASSHPKSSIRC